jgi:flagellar basal-body rod protein FlgB
MVGGNMLGDSIIGKTVMPLLERCLDAYSMRHKAIANNIANVEVPGYNRVQVQFEDKLRQALAEHPPVLSTTDPKHIKSQSSEIEKIRPEVQVDNTEPDVNGVNNVNIDQEMVDLAKNTLDYSTAASLIRNEFSRYRMVISGTGQR